MGWGHCGTDDDGREIGYCIEATCDEPGCEAVIDRGLAYVCGDMHGGAEHGCGKYFCPEHLLHKWIQGANPEDEDDGVGVDVCGACKKRIEGE